MARRRGNSGSKRTWAIIALVAAALALATLFVVLILQLIRMWNSDTAAGTVAVPELKGLTREAAEAALQQVQLRGRAGTPDYSDEVEEGQVLRQDPAAGEKVRPGRTVRYSLSLGRATFTVPDLTGKTLDEAQQTLRKAGLLLGGVQRILDRNHPAGRIINQEPKLGSEYASPVRIDVVPQVSMPNLVGAPLASAEELLTRSEMNLRLALVEYVPEDTVTPGTIVAQDPAPDTMVDMAAPVRVQVGIPTELKLNPRKRVVLSVRVPSGPPKQTVMIKVRDALGEREDYVGQHKPGEKIERTVEVEGEASVRIFVGNQQEPLREERL
jgi:eukaryotic-like serine/threonine-protein kinase